MSWSLRQALRELFGVVPTLDLHGFGVQDALVATAQFIREAHADGSRQVRIVYGKGIHSRSGRGVLREVVPRWLDREGAPYVERYERPPDSTGADGSVRVWLKVLR